VDCYGIDGREKRWKRREDQNGPNHAFLIFIEMNEDVVCEANGNFSIKRAHQKS
jgi:hypothetical protein